MTRIEWTPGALRDLTNIRTYISKDSAFYADRFIARLTRAVDQLENQPRSGRRVPESDNESIRELIFQNYRIIYRCDEESAKIIAVIHGARNVQADDLRS